MKSPSIVAVIVISAALISQGACSRKKAINGADAGATAGTTAVTEGDRSRAQTLVESGRELYRTDQDDQAVAAFEEAIRLDPDLAEAHFRLGLAYDAVEKSRKPRKLIRSRLRNIRKRSRQMTRTPRDTTTWARHTRD